jgi:hypothetical protein
MMKLLFTIIIACLTTSVFCQVQIEVHVKDKNKTQLKGATILETKTNTGSFIRGMGPCTLKLPDETLAIIIQVNHKEYQQLTTKEITIGTEKFYRIMVTMGKKRSKYKVKKKRLF